MDEQAFRPQWQFKFQSHFDKWFGLPQCLKTYHLSLYNIKKDMLLTGPFAMLSMPGPFAMLSMPSFDFHLPPCTDGFLIHLSPLWQLPLWQLPLFPSEAHFPFPCVCRIPYENASRTGRGTISALNVVVRGRDAHIVKTVGPLNVWALAMHMHYRHWVNMVNKRMFELHAV